MSSDSRQESSPAASVDEKVPRQVKPESVSKPAPPPVPPSLPEGGLYGWLAVLGAALALFATFGAALSFGVFQDYYTRVFLNEHSPSAISWIGSTQLFLDFAVGLPTGKLYDAGYFRLTMVAGSLLYVFSFFMLSLAKPHHYYQVFLCQAIGMGVGMGLVIVPALSLPSHYFRRRRSLAMGLVFAGSSLGGVVYPIMLNHLINSSLGFAWGVRATAFMVLGLLIIANLISRPNYPVKAASATAQQTSIFSLFLDVPYMIAIVGSGLVLWGLFFPYFYLQLFAVFRGVDEKLAFYSLTVMNAATVFGRTLPNAVADAYGAFNVAIPMTTITGGLLFAMLGATKPASMFVFAALYGFFSGALGSRIGVGMFIISFALLTGYPITGALLRPPEYLWLHAIIFGGVVILAGACFLVLARSLASKKRETWRL
ncbi:MFS general substrate transporter [Gymnopilus junonius]|uniref:MFS general substrate transporter n=1 Tax=Gymnopilus junonius TaxID=109634 RepID=A0A9P5TIL6_GYMJU|nr:MFS general substrate transporter [Gymnopilus junonius]